jgi:uncharacterized cupin superfamily protein
MAAGARGADRGANAGGRGGGRGGRPVCFPPGPEGAHKTTNRRPETARIAIFSTKTEPAIAVYPDSDKIGIGLRGLFRLTDAVDYWEGEL